MRKIIVAGNWKSHKTQAEAIELINGFRTTLDGITEVENIIFPPYLSIPKAAELLDGSKVSLGAQNMNWEVQGAFTGEVGPTMVKEFCSHILIGHSERRQYYGETDETVNKRTKAALEYGLIPCVCVGETLEENKADQTEAVITRQVEGAFKDISIEKGTDIIVAYEPVWAIGTGLAATVEDANRVIGGYVRPALAKLFGEALAQEIRILYGGSVKPNNAAEYFADPEVDGALVGGACLKADSFIEITEAAK